MPPVPKQSHTSKKQTETELKRRQALDEEAPLPVRKSPRLLQIHKEQTYLLTMSSSDAERHERDQ